MSKDPKQTSDADFFKKYLEGVKIVIADASSGSRVRLSSALCELGAKRNQIELVASVEEAKLSITERKAKFVLCEYQIGNKFGLDLLQDQRAANPESEDCLFILVTGNNSQSAVARAAEEDCDGIILKPYTVNTLKQSLMTALIMKVRPTPYLKKVKLGKDKIVAGLADEAIEILKEAVEMDGKPSLALFYLGQAERLKLAIENAKKDFKKGLNINKIHYKCLMGLYEVMVKEGKSEEAYEVVKRMAQYFPANPKRLATVLKLAIVTKNYEDVESYYQIFTQIDERTDELVNYICSALVVTGKYYLRRKTLSRAYELFDKAAISCAGRTKFLRFIIEILTEFKMVGEAPKFMSRFPAASQKSEDYLTCGYILLMATKNYAQVVQRGRELIREGFKSPTIYMILVEGSFKAGLKDAANDLVQDAGRLHPKSVGDFKNLMERLVAEEAAGGGDPEPSEKPIQAAAQA